MRPTLVEDSGADHAVSFVSQAALDDGLGERLNLRRRLSPIKPTRDIGKTNMINNDNLPAIDVDPETFAITIEGELIEPSPAEWLPLASLYQLF